MTVIQHQFDNAADAQSPLDIVPVAGRIGAEIRGVALSGDLDDLTVDAIKRALGRHKVIFFRGQTQLDDEAHEAFAARLGEPLAHPTVPVAEGSRFLLELNSREGEAASQWHTDITFLPAFPAASILRALVIPPAGGDTLWANAVAAYEGLSAPLKALVHDLRAVHTNAYDYATASPEASSEAIRRHREIFASTVYETEHPVVHVHPVTGEKALLLGNFVKSFVGLSRDDSNRVFQILQDQITKPENTVRWRWQPGDVAIWDNRATQHRAIADFGRQKRHLRRATIAGSVPVAVDGGSSRALKPERLLEAAE
ncbi:alpha-ketoglutarate-dependent taurine dioxygenase [Sphingomonas sp. SORGH_AS 950]|uniref:TauD/TfdA dioxygenase family protein n=1 Tax=unclassified Sphingomonas TaxID=196159 RepID=UPI0027848182|nr:MULTISPECIES: TauD/TfdA family dioxygenase [unclassified Sphingomonas]MDQ1156037.1 alpha-ketoglutarate-dependent taurine dioxygenase [Sphingomonas sp. SORGH_AS_0950]MDR6146397.1 alpha-ketoglutarate-dependent taurine dioxygenase [Sphingomonas sp. SORGH_AS_0870]